MACEITDTAFTDALPDDSWMKDDNPFDLTAIADFNAASTTQAGDTIDPHMINTNSSTPVQNHDAFPFNNAAASPGLNETLSQEPSTYEAYPSMNVNAPSSPYFQSIETNPTPAYHPSPLRNQHYIHRRSVSEPPADMTPPMVFHRQDHFLGKPMHQKSKILKSLPRDKNQRSHPYKTPRGHPHPQALEYQHGYRPGVQRSQTQPLHHAPTSSPMHPYQHAMAPPYAPQPPMMAEQHQYAPVSTSRVCTPIPEAVPMIDPALSQSSTPPAKRQVLSIPVTLDELRTMIFDAVQKAIDGQASKKEDERSEGVSPKSHMNVQMEEVEDEDAGLLKIE